MQMYDLGSQNPKMTPFFWRMSGKTMISSKVTAIHVMNSCPCKDYIIVYFANEFQMCSKWGVKMSKSSFFLT